MPAPPPGLLATGLQIGYHGIHERDDLLDGVEQPSFIARTSGFIWPTWGDFMASKASKEVPPQDEAETAKSKVSAKPKGVKKTAKKTTPRRSRAKVPKEVRLKAFWGVFSQSLNAVVLFEYAQRKQAEKRAEELSASRKSPHFVQLVKKVIEE